jgi:hypothetical protein
MTPQTISLKQVNYQYQHNNYTCAAFIERNERQLNTNWRKKGKKKEKTENETFLLYKTQEPRSCQAQDR